MEVPNIQDVLTKYGGNIVARFGLHNCNKDSEALIIVVYDAESVSDFVEELENIEDISASYMKV